MKEISILIGGEAGDGTRVAGNLIGQILNRMGYYVFIYDDYQSLIRGGHNFSIIRASQEEIEIHQNKIDFLIALDQKTIDFHKNQLKSGGVIIYDSDRAKIDRGFGIEMTKIVQERKLLPVLRNSIALGALTKFLGIDFLVLEKILKENIEKFQKENIDLAKIGFERAKEHFKIEKIEKKPSYLLTGNEAIALGSILAGLEIYVAYPMTPSTSILHFLAKYKDDFGIQVIQPEGEIAGILMVEGAAFAGKKAMIATSGGGFALMCEALSFAGMAEIPILIVLSQRVTPSTGAPTYTMQGDLLFSLYAGHGDFPRIVAAPGNASQAFYLTADLLNLAWKYQVPAILLSDKHLSESRFSLNLDLKKVKEEKPKIFPKSKNYKRYLFTKDGVSFLAFPGTKDLTVKATSYEHDEFGLTTERAQDIVKMIDKRKRKKEAILKDLKKRKTVWVGGDKKCKDILITWGSNIGAVKEIGKKFGYKIIQPIYLEPFPLWEIEKDIKGAKRITVIEANSEGQFAKLLKFYGINPSKVVLKYDGRPFTPQELEKKL